MNFDLNTGIAVFLFVISYIVIVTEKLHKTIIALLGASLLIIFGVITQEEAIRFIDFNTIGLLLGMMILVSIIKQTGLFEYIAIKQVKIAKGNPVKILVLFMLLTGILSAFLDNVTTIIVIVPITLNICKILNINPIPYVIAEIFASNIGGTATLIGDPPNILIGSATHLTFMDFIFNLAPISIIVLVMVILIFQRMYRNDLKTQEDLNKLLSLDEKSYITDAGLLVKSIIVMGFVILGFFLHDVLHLESATVAMAGAAILLTIGKLDVEKVLDDVEWTTLFFFIGLFVLVGGLEKVGVLEYLARFTFEITGGNILITGLGILWISAILSALVDNIPFVTTMIPMVQEFGKLSSASNIDFLWWCLALGACFGGNGTIIGASANVIGADLLNSNSNYNITFKDFLKIGFPIMIFTIIVATIYAVLVLY